ncbi:MAG: hypothetical protein Q9200_004023 [Gallowayella weberi]
MESLAAFSLAAAVIQVVDFSTRVLKQCRELHKSGSLAEHRDSSEVADELVKATTSLKRSLASQPGKPVSQDISDILDLSVKCSSNADDLLAELSKLKIEPGGWRKVSKKYLQAVKRKQWLKEKQEKMERFEKVLNTRILVRLNTQSLKDAHQLDDLEENVKRLALGLEDGCNTVEKLLQAQSHQFISHVDRKFDDQERMRADRQRQKCFFDSLYFPEIHSHEEQISDAFEGTCKWIFHSEDETPRYQPWADFRNWLEKGTGAYWVSGKPGAGKSTLMKYVYEEKRTRELLDSWKDPATPDVTRQSDQSGFYESPSTLAAWTDRRLLSTLKLMLDRRPASAYLCVFIDGLDEFIGDEDLLLDIIRLFVSTPRLKVCVSSRPEQASREEFRRCYQLRVQDLNREDFAAIIQRKLIPTVRQWMDAEDDLFYGLKSLLIKKAQGVWLWLDLIIKDLIKGARDGDTFEELYARLERTPNNIKGLYNQKLQSIDPSYLEEAIGYFHILIVRSTIRYRFVVTMVTILLLTIAEEEWWSSVVDHNTSCFESTAFDSSCRRLEKRLLSRCAGLVEVQDVDDEEGLVVVRHDRNVDFIHRTVQEFLQEEHAAFFQKPSWYSKAIIKLARGCLGLASLAPEPDQEFFSAICYTMQLLRTLGYSPTNHNFGDEFRSVQVDLVNQVIRTMQRIYAAQDEGSSFYNDQRFVDEFLSRGHFYGNPPKNDLAFAAYFGCKEYVKLHLSKIAIFEESLVDFALQGYAVEAGFIPRLDAPDLVAYHLILLNLSHRGFDPNHLVHGNNHALTRWASFFRTTIYNFSSYSTSHQEQDLWVDSCIELVTRLLNLGANPDAVCFDGYDINIENVSIALYFEESLLSLFDRLPAELAHRLQGMKAVLLSAGAERYRRFSSIDLHGVDMGSRRYWISSAQSQQLNDSIHPNLNEEADPAWLKAGKTIQVVENPSVKRFLEDFIANLSEEDQMDEQEQSLLPEPPWFCLYGTSPLHGT